MLNRVSKGGELSQEALRGEWQQVGRVAGASIARVAARAAWRMCAQERCARARWPAPACHPGRASVADGPRSRFPPPPALRLSPQLAAGIAAEEAGEAAATTGPAPKQPWKRQPKEQ